jgi:hypothetical protein
MTDFGNKCIRCERIVCDNCFNKETGRCNICEGIWENCKDNWKRTKEEIKIGIILMTIWMIILFSILLWDWYEGRKVWDDFVILLGTCVLGILGIWGMIKMLKQAVNDFAGNKRPEQ